MNLFFILGNQLFPSKYLDRFKKDHLFFMAEDYELCTYEKHHKQKILLFLSSMRSHAESLKQDKFKLEYIRIEDKEFKDELTSINRQILHAKTLGFEHPTSKNFVNFDTDLPKDFQKILDLLKKLSN